MSDEQQDKDLPKDQSDDSRFPKSALDLYFEGKDLYGDSVQDMIYDEANPFERQVASLVYEIEAKLVTNRFISGVRGEELPPEDIDLSIIKGFTSQAKVATLYHRDGKAQEAQTLVVHLKGTLGEMDGVWQERERTNPTVDKYVAMDTLEKNVKAQIVLGRFAEVAKTNRAVGNYIDSIQDDLAKAIETSDLHNERSIWRLIIELEKLDPEQFGDHLRKISYLLEEFFPE